MLKNQIEYAENGQLQFWKSFFPFNLIFVFYLYLIQIRYALRGLAPGLRLPPPAGTCILSKVTFFRPFNSDSELRRLKGQNMYVILIKTCVLETRICEQMFSDGNNFSYQLPNIETSVYRKHYYTSNYFKTNYYKIKNCLLKLRTTNTIMVTKEYICGP